MWCAQIVLLTSLHTTPPVFLVLRACTTHCPFHAYFVTPSHAFLPKAKSEVRDKAKHNAMSKAKHTSRRPVRRRGRHGTSRRSCGTCMEPWMYTPPAKLQPLLPPPQQQQKQYVQQQQWPSLGPAQPAPIAPPSLDSATDLGQQRMRRIVASTDSPQLARYKALLHQREDLCSRPQCPRVHCRRLPARQLPATPMTQSVNQPTGAAHTTALPISNPFSVLQHVPASDEDEMEVATNPIEKDAADIPPLSRITHKQQRYKHPGKTPTASRLQQPRPTQQGPVCNHRHDGNPTTMVYGKCSHTKPSCGCPVAQHIASTGYQLAMVVAVFLLVAGLGVLAMPVADDTSAAGHFTMIGAGVIGSINASHSQNWYATVCVLCGAMLAWVATGPCKRPLACTICMRRWRRAQYAARGRCKLTERFFRCLYITTVVMSVLVGVFVGVASVMECALSIVCLSL